MTAGTVVFRKAVVKQASSMHFPFGLSLSKARRGKEAFGKDLPSEVEGAHREREMVCRNDLLVVCFGNVESLGLALAGLGRLKSAPQWNWYFASTVLLSRLQPT
jgi:hypothetical protein